MEFVKRCFHRARRAFMREKHNLRSKIKRIRLGRLRAVELEAIGRQEMKDGLNRGARERKIIVSMASYPPRFPMLHIALKRLMDQTVKPDRLIVYLDDFVKPEDVPEAVRALTAFGLEIRFCPHDLKPHKKYFFAMQEFPEDVVITVDDDTIYPRTLIETLAASYRRFPDCVSATKVHKIAFEKDGTIRPYLQWRKNRNQVNRPSMRFLAVGAGGILYPPHAIPPEGFDIPGILQCAPVTDDIWLKFMEVRTGTKVVACGRKVFRRLVGIEAEPGAALERVNLNQGGNDRSIRAMMERERPAPSAFTP